MKLIHGLLQVLRETKAELKERAKMLRYYGISGNVLNNLEKVRFFPTAGRTGRSKNPTRKVYDNQIPNELENKLKQIRELNKIQKNLFSDPPSFVFISFTIPRINSTSAGFRLFNILKILLQNNCRIDFLYCTTLWNDAKYIKSFKGNIKFKHLPLNLENYEDIIIERSPKYIWIAELWRMNYTKHMADLCDRLKTRCPSSVLIVDTVDFHYKEFFRKYELTKDYEDLKRANEFLGYEKKLYRTADIVFVISSVERSDIKKNISGIRRVEVVPNIHEIHPNVKPLQKRRHICFVGHFGNKHNVDAVKFFIRDIWPNILAKNPEIEFHVVGFHSEHFRQEFKAQNVRVIGGLKYLENALVHYKLFVCPMTYGAGMKGKIGGAIAAGLPVVTTAIGAEGFPFANGEECFIADCPEEFAEKCNQCLEDPVLWHNFSVKSRLMIAENFSPGAVARKLEKIFLYNPNSTTFRG